ncbi:protein LATERAL ORGAN BOUNDARIES-like [Mercurialis annua]|uniref:protein LATERAL ORGAN BOUNDARIES-like n=1 Tax=Mercurialis annua TaxID=3986 RepID=UPI00215F97BE|nr:protein LATERAL ORGAN BOUNDARIES-like [Mercurialis annua]
MQRSAPAGNFKNTAPSSSPPPPCIACKYQRRKCPPDCILAPHFPANAPPNKDFENARKLFGVSNIVQTLKNIPDFTQRRDAVVSMVYQANARARDPVGGCQRILVQLNEQIRQSEMELQSVMSQIAYYRNQEFAASSSFYAHNLARTSAVYEPMPVQQYGGYSMYGLEHQEPLPIQHYPMYDLQNQELARDQEIGIALKDEAEGSCASGGFRNSTSSRESVSDFGGVKYGGIESVFVGSDERNKTVSLEFQDPTNYRAN